MPISSSDNKAHGTKKPISLPDDDVKHEKKEALVFLSIPSATVDTGCRGGNILDVHDCGPAIHRLLPYGELNHPGITGARAIGAIDHCVLNVFKHFGELLCHYSSDHSGTPKSKSWPAGSESSQPAPRLTALEFLRNFEANSAHPVTAATTNDSGACTLGANSDPRANQDHQYDPNKTAIHVACAVELFGAPASLRNHQPGLANTCLSVWEPLLGESECEPGTLDKFYAACQNFDGIVLTHTLLGRVFGKSWKLRWYNLRLTRFRIRRTVKKLLAAGVGRNGNGMVVVRAGELGCLYARRGDTQPNWLESCDWYHAGDEDIERDGIFAGALTYALAISLQDQAAFEKVASCFEARRKNVTNGKLGT